MKTILISLVLVGLTFVSPTLAQQEHLTVDVTKLTQQELLVYQKIKRQSVAPAEISMENLTPDKIDKYAAIGRAFGSAFKECWSTVSTDAEKFANSSAGKWAMVMVSWKIMGQDAMNLVSHTVRFITGGFLLTIGIPFFIYIFRRNCVQYPLLKSKTKIGFFTIKKEYNGVNDPIHNHDGPWGYAVCSVVYIILNVIIMFG